VGFVDLVKAYDTANHALLLRILERYGAPSKLVAAIQMIYTDNVCVLKIEKETVEIPQSVGVRQGDNLALVLFLFLMTAFAETLEIVWKQQEIPVVSVVTATGENMINGRLCSHTPTMFKWKNLTAYEILQWLYVVDDAFLFGTRDDLQRGMNLIYHHFGRFGMEMHIGRGTSMSKTECIFFPPPQFFQHSQQRATAATTIQRAFRCANKNATQIIEQPTQSSTCPTDFHIGCRVTVTSSHPAHAGKAGTVCRHTKKYDMFTPDKQPTNIICILPKSLAAYHPDGRCMIKSFDDNEEHDTQDRQNASTTCTIN